MGRRVAHRLTDKEIRGLNEPGRHYDGQGLFLEIAPSGRKRWGLRFDHAGKRHELGGIGVYAPEDSDEHVTLAKARDRAREVRAEWLARAALGAIETQHIKRDVSFKAYALHFIAARRLSWKNPVHAAQWPSSLEMYAFPLIADRPIADVTPGEVRTILAPIWHTKPETARRVRQRMSAIFDAAIAEEIREKANPCTGIVKLLGAQRLAPEHHEALDWRDAPEFIRWLASESGSGPMVRLAFEFLVLTATRVREALDATWDEIDLDAAVWRIARPRMKRADRADKPHEVPLSRRAFEVLNCARRLSPPESRLIFAASNGSALTTDSLRMCLRRGGYTVTAHGFRSTFRDWAAERWASPIADKSAVIEAALDHVPGRVERAYHRSRYLEERRGLMQAWAEYLRGAIK